MSPLIGGLTHKSFMGYKSMEATTETERLAMQNLMCEPGCRVE